MMNTSSSLLFANIRYEYKKRDSDTNEDNHRARANQRASETCIYIYIFFFCFSSAQIVICPSTRTILQVPIRKHTDLANSPVSYSHGPIVVQANMCIINHDCWAVRWVRQPPQYSTTRNRHTATNGGAIKIGSVR